LIKQISAIVIGMIFLISSSGFLIYKSHCSCTGNEQVSIIVQNDVCETDTQNSCCNAVATSCCLLEDTQHCGTDLSDCDCNTQEVTFIKLTNNIVKEEVKFTKIEPFYLTVAYATLQLILWETDDSVDSNTSYIDPPLPIHNSSLEFLIHIQQLKIPALA